MRPTIRIAPTVFSTSALVSAVSSRSSPWRRRLHRPAVRRRHTRARRSRSTARSFPTRPTKAAEKCRRWRAISRASSARRAFRERHSHRARRRNRIAGRALPRQWHGRQTDTADGAHGRRARQREDWERDLFTLIEENGFFFGRGSSDDKAGVAALTATFLRLKAEKFVPRRDLIIFFSGDEETNATSVTATIKDHRELVDAEFAFNADAGGGILAEADAVNRPCSWCRARRRPTPISN